MARETYGDHFKSSYLNMALNKKILEIQKAATKKANQTYWLIYYNERAIEKEGCQTKKYFEVFNTCCKVAFFTAIIKLQNYNLVLDDDANHTSADDLDDPHMEEKDNEITEKFGYNRFMLDDAWSIGWERLERDNVRKR